MTTKLQRGAENQSNEISMFRLIHLPMLVIYCDVYFFASALCVIYSVLTFTWGGQYYCCSPLCICHKCLLHWVCHHLGKLPCLDIAPALLFLTYTKLLLRGVAYQPLPPKPYSVKVQALICGTKNSLLPSPLGPFRYQWLVWVFPPFLECLKMFASLIKQQIHNPYKLFQSHLGPHQPLSIGLTTNVKQMGKDPLSQSIRNPKIPVLFFFFFFF